MVNYEVRGLLLHATRSPYTKLVSQLVTAVRVIIDVNETFYPELYWALRGGGNNFGIVTRSDLETYP